LAKKIKGANTREEKAIIISQGMAPPRGLQQIMETFGDIFRFIRDDGTIDARWEKEILVAIDLPFAIPLSWNVAQSVQKILCHKKLGSTLSHVFEDIAGRGLGKHIVTFGGCYNFRVKRKSEKLSTHSWGIAIDLNPETNQQGKSGDMHSAIVDIFKQYGFTWGGDWPGRSKDPMHFQFCTGY